MPRPGSREELHQELAAASSASRRLAPQDPRLTGHTGTMTLNGAYLVDLEHGAEFEATVRRLQSEHPEARHRRARSLAAVLLRDAGAVSRRRPPRRGAPAGQIALVDLLDRLLGTGVVLAGDVVISLAGVDLVQVRLHALITSIRADMTGRDHERDGAAMTEPRRILPQRLETDAESVEKDLFKLVLTIVELVRQLMEKQALRRVDEGDLTDEQVEGLGTGLMHLEAAMEDLKGRYGLTTADLNIDLGPLGTLLSE